MEPRYLLTVRVKNGLVIRDSPRAQSDGGLAMRTVPVGTRLYAYSILTTNEGVQYARLVPQRPERPEWVRVKEVDESVIYVDVLDMGTVSGDGGQDGDLVQAVNRLADAVFSLAAKK